MRIEEGKSYTYFPPQNKEDNLHFECEVARVTAKRVKIRLRDGKTRSVSAKRLVAQHSLLA